MKKKPNRFNPWEKKKGKKEREYNKCRAKEREANLVGKLRCQEE